MSNNFDTSELTAFERDLLRLANDRMPRESKKFLRKEGTKLRRDTLKKAKQEVEKDTGNYFKSIRRGKVYDYNGDLSIRVFSYSPHAHLIEEGHRQVLPDGTEVGFVQGNHVFEHAQNEFKSTYYADVQEFLDEVLEKGL